MQKNNRYLAHRYMPALHPTFKADCHIDSSLMSQPMSLDSLVSNSDLIATGQFLGILQHRHCPRNSYGPSQCTIYEFQIHTLLKRESPIDGDDYLEKGNQKFIKIFQLGGPLKWQSKEIQSRGSGYKISGMPFPIINERYIVFLKDIRHQNRIAWEKGVIETTQDGIRGESQYSDEFNYTYPGNGLVLLRQNRAIAGQVVDDPRRTHWALGQGFVSSRPKLQVTDVSEAEAVDNIKKIVAGQEPRMTITRTDGK